MTPVVDPGDYPQVLAILERGEDAPEALRRRLAAKAFRHTQGYDAAIAGWLEGLAAGEEDGGRFPLHLFLDLERELEPRYGENPHQPAAAYAIAGGGGLLGDIEQLGGKELSYNNLLDADEQAAKSMDLTRVESVAGRASFFAAWSHYYLGLATQPATPSHPGFVRARDLFRRILGIEGSYSEITADSLGLDSIWRARTLIGLGMAEASSGNVAGSKVCFDLLERGPAPAEIHEMTPY